MKKYFAPMTKVVSFNLNSPIMTEAVVVTSEGEPNVPLTSEPAPMF